ncbi:hypothetical protein ONZ45_g19534 [Pleurotus djamor]|nr:hypothetical protein ONZ45_g19534 [Pleurotus djamor]
MFKPILLAILLISSTSSTSTTSAYTTTSTSNPPPLPPGPFNLNDPKLTYYTAVEKRKRKRTPGQVKSDMSRLGVSIKDFNVSIAEFPQGSASHALIQALVRSVQLVLFVPIIGIHRHYRLR